MQMPTDRDLIARGLSPFSEEEQRSLKDYRSLVADLNESALAQRDKLTMHIGAQGEDALDGVTRDEIKSLATDFRRLGWNNEASGATFNQIRNLIARHAAEAATPESQTLLAWFKELKTLRAQMLKQSRVLGWVIEQPDGSTVEITPEELLDVFINGAVFHSDPEMRDRWTALGGWQSGLVLWNVVLALWDFAELFRALDRFVETVLEVEEVLRDRAEAAGDADLERT